MALNTENSDRAADYAAATEAIRTGDVRALSRLLREHPSLASARGAGGRTCLNEVADWPGRWPRRLESAALLIDAGANVNARACDPDDGETTLQWAVSCDDAALTELLLEAGSPVNGLNDSRRPLAQALFYESGEAARVLVRHGATIDLEFASGLGRIDLLPSFFADNGGLLLAAGTHHAPINEPVGPAEDARSELLEQALVYASINAQAEAAGFLIDHGADVAAEPSGFTHQMPMVSWAKHHPEMVEFLIGRGAPHTSPTSAAS
jgi:ankyrin repeat protein